MKRKSKFHIVFIMLCMFTLLLSACSTGEKTDTTAKESKKIRILANVIGGKDDAEQKLFIEEIEKKTGLQVEMIKPPANYDQKLFTSISSGEQYDLIYLTKNVMDILVEQGALMELNNIIKDSSVLSDKTVIPDSEWKTITYKDGKIYGVFNKMEGGTMPIIRQDWLDKLGLNQPKTLDEFYTVLKAFKEQDPDGNGKADTYGISTVGLNDIQPFMSAEGVKYKYVMKGGKRTIPYATEAAIPVYEWLANLYKEGILDPNFVTNDTAKMRELFLTDRVGMVTYWDAWVGLFNNIRQKENPATTFKAVGIAGVKGPNGYMLHRGDPSLFAIPANAKNVEGALKFLEFWHSEEGNLLSTLGIKGHDYTVKDGNYELTNIGQEHGMDHGVITPNNTKFQNPIGLLPGVEEARKIIMENNSTLEIATDKWPDAEKIVTNYAFKAIMGEIPAKDAVKQMNKELKAANLID
ncbi:ABC transporter substrate-binding protein [Bacillus cereus]|nr:ABC transporter substrate-binding protein [Bacillus cereus]PGU68996.1 ABC transporter substrate-binding protein [Bacillus cereus]